MLRRREPRVNIHHLVVEAGNFEGRELEPRGVKIFSGFRIGHAPSSSGYPIPYGPGHGYRELNYVNGSHGCIPRFERKGKKQPDIVKGLVDSVSVKKSEADRILDGEKHSSVPIRAIQSTRKAVADIAIVSFFHFNFGGVNDESRAPILGVDSGRIIGSGSFFDQGDNRSGDMVTFALNEGGSFDFVYSVPEAMGYCCLRAEFDVERNAELQQYEELDYHFAPKPRLEIAPTLHPHLNLFDRVQA